MSISEQPGQDASTTPDLSPLDADETPNRRRPSVLLGLFILAQLGFLLAANFLGMLDYYGRHGFPERVKAPVEQAAPPGGQLWRLNEAIYTPAWHWGLATGQPQNWGLFAPVGTDCAFPALQLRWDMPVDSPLMLARPLHLLAVRHPLQVALVAAHLQTLAWQPPDIEQIARHLAPLAARQPAELVVLQHAAGANRAAMPFEPHVLLSDNEPRDLQQYVRIGKFRLRRLESALLPYLPERATREKTLQDWRERIESHVRQYDALITTYCRFRLEAAELERPPSQVILLMRRYRIRPPDQEGRVWTGPEVIPIARWQPGRTCALFAPALEWYNPETGRFELIVK